MNTYEVEVTEVTIWYEIVDAESEEDAQRLALEEIYEGRGCVDGGREQVVTNTTLQGEL